MTQTQAIRAHLAAGHELTALEALRRFGCLRLAARIDDLRRAGMGIESRTVRQNGKHYAAYRLASRQLDLWAA